MTGREKLLKHMEEWRRRREVERSDPFFPGLPGFGPSPAEAQDELFGHLADRIEEIAQSALMRAASYRVDPPAEGDCAVADDIAKAAAVMWCEVMAHRDAYLKAWIAATGLDPRECVLVEERDGMGGMKMYAKRKEDT